VLKMVEIWKVKRELLRIWQQIKAPVSIILSPILRHWHDFRKEKLSRYTQGSLPLQNDVAVLLVYRPAGLLASHFETAKHLAKNGFAPLVIVNHKLDDSDRRALAVLSWTLIERPNTGYDFGGYRDAVLFLRERNIFPKTLVFLNDSVWYPVKKDDGLLSEVRGASCDLYGFAKDRHKRSNKPEFIQSFFFAFKGDVIGSDVFYRYWLKLPMYNNKWAVIRLLEMKLSPYFERHGYSTDAKFEKSTFPIAIAQSERKRQIAYLYCPEAQLGSEARQIENCLQSGAQLSLEEWQSIVALGRVDGHILKCSPALLFDVLDVTMLKKLGHGHFVKQRRAIVSGKYLDTFCRSIAEEIENWDKS